MDKTPTKQIEKKKTNILFIIFRGIFCLSLLVLTLKFYNDRYTEDFFLRTTLLKLPADFAENFVSTGLAELTIYIKDGAFAFGAILLLFGSVFGKLMIIFGVILQILLIYNPFLYTEERHRTISFALIGIVGLTCSF